MTRGRSLNSRHPSSLTVPAIRQSRGDLSHQTQVALTLDHLALKVSLDRYHLLLDREILELLRDDNCRRSLDRLGILLTGMIQPNTTATNRWNSIKEDLYRCPQALIGQMLLNNTGSTATETRQAPTSPRAIRTTMILPAVTTIIPPLLLAAISHWAYLSFRR